MLRQQIEQALKQTVNNVWNLYKKEDNLLLETYIKELSRLDLFTLLSTSSDVKLNNILYTDSQDIVLEFYTILNSNLILNEVDLDNIRNLIMKNVKVLESPNVNDNLRSLCYKQSTIDNITNLTNSNNLLLLTYVLRLFILETMIYIKGNKE